MLARFLGARGFFSALLHQFFSAESIQVSEECVLLIFLGFLIFGHACTVREPRPHVNNSNLVVQLWFEERAQEFCFLLM